MATPKPVRKEAKKLHEHVRKTQVSPQSKEMNRIKGEKSLVADTKKIAARKLSSKKVNSQRAMKYGGTNTPLKDYHEKKPKGSTRV
jgi:hypothetical protein